MSLFLMMLVGLASAADVKTQVAKALYEAERANARVTRVEHRVTIVACSQAVDELLPARNKNPFLASPASEWEALVAKTAATCDESNRAELLAAWAAYKARNAAPAATPAPTTSTRPASAPTTASAPVSTTVAATVDDEEHPWTQKGWVLSGGAGAGAMRIDGHVGAPRLTSFLASTSVELRYSFGRVGLGGRATFLPDLGGGMAFAGHLVPSVYVDENHAYFRVEPLIGYSFQEMGEYNEDRVELGVSVAGRFARNWEVLGTAVYGLDPDVANTPDNAGRFMLEFRGTIGLH